MPTGLPGFKVFYGQHWMVYQGAKPAAAGSLPIFGHGGSDGTLALVFPEQDLMAFYFTQSRGGLSLYQFESLVAPLVGLPAAPSRQRFTADKLRSYAGQYRDRANGPVTYVFLHGNRLAVQVPGQGVIVPNWPNADGRWALGPAAPDVALRFDQGDKGEVTKLRIQQGKNELVQERVAPARDLPTAEQFLAEYRKKQGGKHIDALRSLRLDGTLSMAAGKMKVSLLAAGERQAVQRVKTDKGEHVVILDRGRAWRQVPGKPFEEEAGLFQEQSLFLSPLALLGDWKQGGRAVDVVRKDRVGEEEVWVVRVAGKLLPPTTRYVSCKSGLVLQEDFWVTAKGVGTVPVVVRYEDYREVAGVQLAFRRVSRNPFTGRVVVQYTEAKANVEVPKGAFSVPPSAK
jgi:hypothetical protein